MDFKELVEKWPSAIVARSEVRNFSGGLISEGTMANVDCRGEGPEGGFWFGKKKAYPTKNLAAWLEKRASTVKPLKVAIKPRTRHDQLEE